MEFNNYAQLHVFDNFFRIYGERLNTITEVKESDIHEICIVSETRCQKKAGVAIFLFDKPDFFFECQLCFTPPYIGCSEAHCIAINLTEEEKYAMIAHELGHIYFTPHFYPSTEKKYLNKELNADSMAVRLDLKESLISGLEKLEKCKDVKNKKQLQQRIDYWSSH